AMKYMLLIQHGDMPRPGSPEGEALSGGEQKAIAADYQAVDRTDGVTPGAWLESPESATSVRVPTHRRRSRRHQRALELVHSDSERRFLEQRLAELES